MGSSGADQVPISSEAGGSETTIEIKIKTLDAQTYTLRVDKQMPVPALKERIASVTGVVSEQQRLICRGRVLKDDQLLSAYHVEDGHTLHLVVRQPPSSEASDPASGTSRAHSGQVAPRVVIETFSMPDGDAVPPEISRILSAVLGSFGLSNIRSDIEGLEITRERSTDRSSDAGNTVEPDQAGIRVQFDRSQSAFVPPTGVSLDSVHPPVIPDSLTTLSQYLSHLRRDFDTIGEENNTQRTEPRNANSTSQSGSAQERLPTPASLAGVMMSSRQLLIEQVAECLHRLARQLENQENVTDSAARSSTQSAAWRTGFQLHNLGAFLLELGRTTMTLRLGQAPSEAVVYAGPAVFINSSGPNPLMVQPFPFQSGSSFGAPPVGSMQPGGGLVNDIGTGLLPRRIDIQIRRGSSTAAPDFNNRENHINSQQASGQRNTVTGSSGENLGNQTPSGVTEGLNIAGESGAVRVVPLGAAMVAAVPGSLSRLSSNSSGSSIGLYYPVLGRFQHVSSRRGSQASGEQTQPLSPAEAGTDQQNVEHHATGAGSLPMPNPQRQGLLRGRSINIDVQSADGTQINPESEVQLSSNVLQMLRSLFPGGEIHVEGASSQEMPTSSVPDNMVTTASAPGEVEPTVTDEGIFLSNLLRQIMPMLPQSSTAFDSPPEASVAHDSSTQAENSGEGTSRRRNNSDPDPPNPKRQKMDYHTSK